MCRSDSHLRRLPVTFEVGCTSNVGADLRRRVSNFSAACRVTDTQILSFTSLEVTGNRKDACLSRAATFLSPTVARDVDHVARDGHVLVRGVRPNVPVITNMQIN